MGAGSRDVQVISDNPAGAFITSLLRLGLVARFLEGGDVSLAYLSAHVNLGNATLDGGPDILLLDSRAAMQDKGNACCVAQGFEMVQVESGCDLFDIPLGGRDVRG